MLFWYFLSSKNIIQVYKSSPEYKFGITVRIFLPFFRENLLKMYPQIMENLLKIHGLIKNVPHNLGKFTENYRHLISHSTSPLLQVLGGGVGGVGMNRSQSWVGLSLLYHCKDAKIRSQT